MCSEGVELYRLDYTPQRARNRQSADCIYGTSNRGDRHTMPQTLYLSLHAA